VGDLVTSGAVRFMTPGLNFRRFERPLAERRLLDGAVLRAGVHEQKQLVHPGPSFASLDVDLHDRLVRLEVHEGHDELRRTESRWAGREEGEGGDAAATEPALLHRDLGALDRLDPE